jgi:hypothetical protein
MLAPLLVSLWLVTVVVAVVWITGVALHLVSAAFLLTTGLCRDLMAYGASRLGFGDSTCG